MIKRIAAAALWLMAIWTVWSFAAFVGGFTDVPGLVLGLVAAALFGLDPMHRIWSRTKATAEPAELTTVGAPQLS